MKKGKNPKTLSSHRFCRKCHSTRSNFMKKHRFVVVAILLGMLVSDAAFGASKKKESPPQIKAPTITSVTATSITVTDEKATKTLTINQFTEITVNGQRATAAD